MLPAVLQLALALAGAMVLFHFASPAAAAPKPDAETAEAVPGRQHYASEVEAEPLWDGDRHRA